MHTISAPSPDTEETSSPLFGISSSVTGVAPEAAPASDIYSGVGESSDRAGTFAGLSFFEQQGRFGFENFGLGLWRDGEPLLPEGYSCSEGHHLSGTFGGSISARLSWEPGDQGVATLRVSLRNETLADLRLDRISFGQFGPQAKFNPSRSHVLGWGLRYAHTGNLRTERYPFCAADYPYARQLPIEPRVLGDTEDQPFPALYVYNEHTKWGLVIGALEQQRSVPVFRLRRHALFRPDAFAEFAVDWDPPQSRGLLLQPGQEVALEPLYFQLQHDVGPDLAFEGYLDFLAERHSFRGPTTPVNEAALHCTWNYGVFANQQAAPLLKTARFIAEHLPQIKFFLVDDGYLRHTPETSRVFLNRFYPETEQDLSEETWPGGMRAFTAELRSLGLRPGVWWTPTVRLPCQLLDDHPDWFLRKMDGSLYLIGTNNAYLDYSHPEALAYLDRTLSIILGEWGMEACKIDFWSQNFETRDAVLHDPSLTSLEVRKRFFETIRRHMPDDGVIMSCIAMGMGNPFLGEDVDTYRCSMDITDGLWHEQIENCLWSLPMLGFGGRRSLLLNTDSVGINLDLPDNENFFRLTWCYITMGLIETGGRLEELPDMYFQAMKKLTGRCDRGYPCRCPDQRAYTGVPLPESLYVDFPEGSPTALHGIRQSVAFFNWSEEPRLISVSRQVLGHSSAVEVEDFWTGEKSTWDDDFVSLEVQPHCARLFDVRW
jgi:hypothetical protein